MFTVEYEAYLSFISPSAFFVGYGNIGNIMSKLFKKLAD